MATTLPGVGADDHRVLSQPSRPSRHLTVEPVAAMQSRFSGRSGCREAPVPPNAWSMTTDVIVPRERGCSGLLHVIQDCLLFVAEVSSSLQYVVALSFSSSHPCSPTSDPYVLSIYAISRPCIGIHQHTAVAGTLRTRLSSFWRWRRLWAYEATKLTAPWWPVVSKTEFLHMELFDYYSDPMGDHQTPCHRRTHPKKMHPKTGTTLPHLARNRKGAMYEERHHLLEGVVC